MRHNSKVTCLTCDFLTMVSCDQMRLDLKSEKESPLSLSNTILGYVKVKLTQNKKPKNKHKILLI